MTFEINSGGFTITRYNQICEMLPNLRTSKRRTCDGGWEVSFDIMLDSIDRPGTNGTPTPQVVRGLEAMGMQNLLHALNSSMQASVAPATSRGEYTFDKISRFLMSFDWGMAGDPPEGYWIEMYNAALQAETNNE